MRGDERPREIGRSARFIVRRERRGSEGGTAVVKTIAADHPDRAALARRLLAEHRLLAGLAVEGVVRPLGLELRDGVPALMLPDLGPADLQRWLRGRALGPAEFLDLAIALADIVARLHARGIIHGDLAPANLVRAADGRLTLVDFETAAALADPASTHRPLAAPEGSLPYLAPEQTGRMSRGVDRRSDLYAFGALAYELLTGAPPFAAVNPLQLVHAHLAQVPIAPHRRNPAVPPALSALVLKLLEKEPDRRYQSAEALLADLQQARARLQGAGTLAPFPLGVAEPTGELPLPGRLFRREAELRALGAAWERAAAGASELLLLIGPSGVGKSALADRLRDEVVGRGGRFVSAKIDQRPSHRPYASWVEALRGLVAGVMQGPEERQHAWRARLTRGDAAGLGALRALLPELEELIGPQPRGGALPSQGRFEQAFVAFVRAIATQAEPVVVFLDDLQWADAGSLRLIGELALAPDLHYLLVLGAARPGDGAEDAVAHLVDPLAAQGAQVGQLLVEPLPPEGIADLLSEALESAPARVLPLAELVHRKTAGNPYFVRRLLRHLHQIGLLRRAPADSGSEPWTWDLPAIELLDASDNVVELLLAGMRRLPPSTQEILSIAACMGNRFELGVVEAVRARLTTDGGGEAGGPDDVARAVRGAVREGHLVPWSGPGRDARAPAAVFQFAHDRVQQASYALIPEPRRKLIHGQLGRELSRGAMESSERLFAAVDQLQLGASLIEAPAERIQMAELCLQAGMKARIAFAYGSALAYLREGLAKAADAWDTHHALVFALHREAIECAHAQGDDALAVDLTATVLAHATSAIERAELIKGRLLMSSAQQVPAEGLAAAVEGLRLCGIELPDEPAASVAAEIAAVTDNLRGRSIEEIVDAPAMESAESLICVEILSLAAIPIYMARQELYPFIVARMVNLSLIHGNAPASPTAYVSFGVALRKTSGDLATGNAWGKLGVALARRMGDPVQECRAVSTYVGLVQPGREPLRLGLALLQEAQQRGLEAGEIVYASFCLMVAVAERFHQGEELSGVLARIDAGLAMVRRFHAEAHGAYLLCYRRAIRRLHGVEGASSATEEDRREEAWDTSMTAASAQYLFVEELCGLVTAYLLGDLEAARRHAETAGPLVDLDWVLVSAVELTFFTALTLAATANGLGPDQRRIAVGRIAPHARELVAWADNCPENFRHKQLLVAAEVARLEERGLEAAALYDGAIEAAAREGFSMDEALANELAGRCFRDLGRVRIADVYLGAAMGAYARWGATAKVRALAEEFPGVAPPGATSPGPSLDLHGLFRAAETISKEVVLDRLLERMIEVCLATAGAQSGALVLLERGELVVRVVGSVSTPATLERTALDRCPGISTSVVEAARATGQVVALGDAAQRSRFSGDPHLASGRVRSVLAVPIRREDRLVGVLYLENNLASQVFTADRAALLQLLASQMAVSLENSLLFEELRQEIEERKRAEAAAQRAIQLRDEFLTVASHELNTPVAALQLTIRGMYDGGFGPVPDSLTQPLRIAVRQTWRLQRLIGELLQVRVMENGALEIRREPLDLAGLVEDLVESQYAAAVRPRGPLGLELERGVQGRWDRLLLERIASNLISNAIKFGSGKPIAVRVGQRAGVARLEVEDHGIGIPPERLPLIFQRFERGVSASHYGGFGLGLYIVKQLAEAMQGSVHAESTPEVGSRLWVDLPCQPRE